MTLFVLNGTYTALTLSLLIHLLIVLLMVLTQSTEEAKFKKTEKKIAIQSFIYHAPKVETPSTKVVPEQPVQDPLVEALSRQKTPATPIVKEIELSDIKKMDKAAKPIAIVNSALDKNKSLSSPLPPALPQKKLSKPLPKGPPELPKNKLDSFTQLQRLRSKLNRGSNSFNENPYQRHQPPSAFNTQPETVPHSVPLKDKEKEREKNTKNMGAGIAITKGEDGRCSIKQDLGVYGLSEGSSIQYFNCGESKFDKSFREHMKKVKNKLGKKN